MMSRTHVAALALSLVLAPSPLAPPALAQSQTPAAATPQPAATQSQKPAAPPQSLSPAPLDKRAEKVRRSIERIGMSQPITVIMPREDDLHGTIIKIGEQTFELAEVDLRQTITVRYGDVKKVRKGYRPHPDIFTGERNTPPKGVRIATFVGIFGALALPLLILAASKEH